MVHLSVARAMPWIQFPGLQKLNKQTTKLEVVPEKQVKASHEEVHNQRTGKSRVKKEGGKGLGAEGKHGRGNQKSKTKGPGNGYWSEASKRPIKQDRQLPFPLVASCLIELAFHMRCYFSLKSQAAKYRVQCQVWEGFFSS